MTRQWNPSDPFRIGLEFEPLAYGWKALSADTAAVVQQMEATSADTIDRVRPWLRVDRAGSVVVDVYGVGSELIGDTTTSVYLPTNDEGNIGITDPAGGGSNLWQYVDDTNPRLSSTGGPHPDFLIANGGSGHAVYQAQLGGLSGALAGRRILAVRIVGIINGYPGFPAPWGHLHMKLGGVAYFPGVGQYLSAAHETLAITELTYNPATGRPWLVSELQALATIGNGIGVQFGFGTTGPSAGVIATLGLEVVHCAENRLGFGAASASTSGWLDVPIITPAGGSGFARSNGSGYVYSVRRRAEPAQTPPPFLGAMPEWTGREFPASLGLVSPTGNDGWAHYRDAVPDGWGGLHGLGLPSQTVWPITLRRTTLATTPDGQGYHAPLYAQVQTGQAARSGFRSTGAGTLGVVRVAARPLTNGPLGDLLMQVRRTADNVAVGGVGTLTRAMWDAAPQDGSLGNRPVKYINVPLASSGPISGATAYYVEVTAPSCTGITNINGTDAWELVALDADPHGEATYGEQADFLSWPNTIAQGDADAPVQVMTQPTAPTTLTVTMVVDTLGDDGTACPLTSIQHPRLDWTATALGVDFGYYEVQRREPTVSADWHTIGRLTVENPIDSVGFTDFEAKRNVSADYRVRVVRRDGGFSAWRDGNTEVTPTMDGCQLIVTSNELPLVVARNDTGPREWQFLSAEEWKFMALYGRDYQVAFRSVADRGFRWPLSLIMYGRGDQSTDPPVAENWDQFLELEAWSTFGVFTVAVLTEAGQRAWGVLRLLSGTRQDNQAHVYLARVEFTQTRRVPLEVERVFGG